MILLSIVRILYSLMLIILASFIVGIIVVDVVKLVCFSYIYKYIYIYIYIYYLLCIVNINYRPMLEEEIKMWTKTQKMTLRWKMTLRRIMTQMMIDFPIFMFSSLVKDIIAFMY